MAINFLNTVDFNKNQLNFARIQNLGTDPSAANSSIGQIYFNTTADTLKQYVADAGSGAAGWIEVGATSAVESIIAGTGIGVSAAIGNVTVRNTGLVTVLDGTYIDLTKQGGGDNTQLTADLSAVDGTSTAADRFLTKNNKWATIPFGDITEVQESTVNNRLGIDVVNPTGPIPVVGLDIVGRTNLGATPAGSDELLIYDTSTTTNKAVTVSNLVGGFETTYTLPVTAGSLTDPKSGIITLTGTDGTTDPVTFVGTTGRVEVAGNPGASTITVDLTDNVSIVGKIDVLGSATSSFAGDIDMNNNKLTEVKTGTVATDGVNLGQVEALVAGIGLFKGGYNATTGLTTDLGAGNGSLDGASNIALDQGDFFVVTIKGGAFYTETLEVGDMIFANEAIAANSTPPISKYTVVIQDANIAGAGSTDGGTAKGVAGFDSASFNVSASGWVQLDAQKNPNGAKQSLNNTAPSTRTESGGVTTFTLNLAAASLFGSGALSENVKVEITEGAAPFETVYACVTRSGTASMAIAFTGSIANDAYQVLLSHV